MMESQERAAPVVLVVAEVLEAPVVLVDPAVRAASGKARNLFPRREITC